MAAHERGVVAGAELGRAGRLVAHGLEPGNAPAFLVDGDDGLRVAEVAQVVEEFPQSGGGLDVAGKKDVTARLHPAQGGGGDRIEFGSGQADEEQLAGVGSVHLR